MDVSIRYLRAGQRAVGKAESVVRKVAMPLRSYGFPYRAPNIPKGVDVPKEPSQLGADYDTDWARRPVARAARGVITEGPLRLLVQGLAAPEVIGLDRLTDLAKLDVPPPVIFAPNHHSHLDTGLMITSIPFCWRRHLVVAADVPLPLLNPIRVI